MSSSSSWLSLFKHTQKFEIELANIRTEDEEWTKMELFLQIVLDFGAKFSTKFTTPILYRSNIHFDKFYSIYFTWILVIFLKNKQNHRTETTNRHLEILTTKVFDLFLLENHSTAYYSSLRSVTAWNSDGMRIMLSLSLLHETVSNGIRIHSLSFTLLSTIRPEWYNNVWSCACVCAHRTVVCVCVNHQFGMPLFRLCAHWKYL